VTITIRPTAVRLRPKNQITVPEAALAEVGLNIGDRMLVTVEDGVIKLEPIRTSYFGVLKGVWGPNATEEIRAERDRDWR
jgi:bifunctional DNA-binding transcriptional regulator/antitoxin component of YhaV-PrlF toxin-antitoxin module